MLNPIQDNLETQTKANFVIDEYRVNTSLWYRILVKSLARILYTILNLLSWKKDVIIANLRETKVLDKEIQIDFHTNSKADLYMETVKKIHYNLAYESASFIFGRLNLPVEIDLASQKEIQEIRNSGGLMLAAHYGNFELKGYIMRYLGIDFTATYLPLKNSIANNILKKLRDRDGVFSDDFLGDFTSTIKIIKDKKVFTFINDQNYRSNHALKTSFFDSELELSPLAKTLWKRTKCQVWFVYMQRQEISYKLCFEKLDLHENDLSDEFEKAYVKALQKSISSDRYQYFGWSHRMFHSNKPKLYEAL